MQCQDLDALLTSNRPLLLYDQSPVLRELIDQLVTRLGEECRNNVQVDFVPFDSLPSNCKDALRWESLYSLSISAHSISKALESQMEDIIRNSEIVLKLIDDELSSFITSIHYEFGLELYDDHIDSTKYIGKLGGNSILFNDKITWQSLSLYLSLKKNLSSHYPVLASALHEKLETKAMILAAESRSIQGALNDIVYSKILVIFDSINNNEHKSGDIEEEKGWVMVDRPLGMIGNVVNNVGSVVSSVSSVVSDYITGSFTTVEKEIWDNCLKKARQDEYIFTVVLWYSYRPAPASSITIKKLNFRQYDFDTVIEPKYFPNSFDPALEGNRCFYLSSGIGMRVHPLEVVRQMRELARNALDNIDYLEYLRQNGVVVDHSAETDGSIQEMFEEILARGNYFDMDALRYLWPQCFRGKLLCVFSFDTSKSILGQNAFKACPFYQHPSDDIDSINQDNIVFLHHNGAHFTLLQPKNITEADMDNNEICKCATTNFFQSLKEIFDEHNRTIERMKESRVPCSDLRIPYQPYQVSLIYDPAINYAQHK